MNINSLSASSFSTHSWCPFKYYLQYTLGFQDEAGPAALIGTISHKVLEILSHASINKHDKKSKIWDESYLWEISFNHYYNEVPHIAETIANDKLKKVCSGIHELLKSEYTPIRDNTISAEVSFDQEINDADFSLNRDNDNNIKYLKVRGRIDRVDKIDDQTVEIIDYKTGSRVDWDSKERNKKDSLSLYNDIQPRMYHLAAKSIYPWAKNFLITFIYIVDGGPITIPFCDYDIDFTKEILRKKLKNIKNDDNPDRNITWKCKSLCGFGKSGTCDMVWQEKQDLGKEFVEEKYAILNVKKHGK
jgi:hypothetical protein